jgi:hypothetical protein
MKWFSLILLFVSLVAGAQSGVKHRGELIKVISPTQIKVQESKKPIVITLRAVSDQGLSKSQKTKAINYVKERLTGQVLIWEEFKDGVEVSPSGLGSVSRSLLEWGLVKKSAQAPESFQQFEDLGKTRQVGIWSPQ